MSRLGAGAEEESHEEWESDLRCSLLPATAAQDAGFYDHGGINTGARHWGECRDFYAGECGPAAEPTRDRSEDAAEELATTTTAVVGSGTRAKVAITPFSLPIPIGN